MRRSRRIAWWTAYGLGAAAVIAGLGWTSVRVVRLEGEERAARLVSERQETLRAALWRLDFWLAPRLARESARTWLDYEPYHPQTVAFNRLLEPIAEGEVLLPSPLLTFTSTFLIAHFQYRVSTGFTSPQLPSESFVALGTVACGPVPSDPARKVAFAARVATIDPAELDRRIRHHELAIEKSVGDASTWIAAQPGEGANIAAAEGQSVEGSGTPQQTQDTMPQQNRGQSQVSTKVARSGKRAFTEPGDDYRARQSANSAVQQALVPPSDEQLRNASPSPSKQVAVKDLVTPAAPSGPVEVGPMLPIWLDAPASSDAPPQLLLARRVRFESETVLQGVIVDWPALRTALLGHIEPIAPGADLEPTSDIVGDDARRLASIPAVLRLAPEDGAEELGVTEHPGAVGLALVWCAALGAIAASGLALRSSIGSAVRTSRFASSVTHELRTPLTTFRLYAEMLADGVVPSEERKREYYATLRDESARLGLLVENVLAWSRAEDGRTPRELQPTTVEGLRDHVAPLLARRCAEAGDSFEVQVTADGECSLRTDPDRVAQILFNFVDNACKYAGAGATVRLAIERIGDRLAVAIEDSGPGVPDRLRARIFRAFDRGERGPGDAVRGLGLGLAISSELAGALGGRLRCERSAMGGARFALELPLRA